MRSHPTHIRALVAPVVACACGTMYPPAKATYDYSINLEQTAVAPVPIAGLPIPLTGRGAADTAGVVVCAPVGDLRADIASVRVSYTIGPAVDGRLGILTATATLAAGTWECAFSDASVNTDTSHASEDSSLSTGSFGVYTAGCTFTDGLPDVPLAAGSTTTVGLECGCVAVLGDAVVALPAEFAAPTSVASAGDISYDVVEDTVHADRPGVGDIRGDCQATADDGSSVLRMPDTSITYEVDPAIGATCACPTTLDKTALFNELSCVAAIDAKAPFSWCWADGAAEWSCPDESDRSVIFDLGQDALAAPPGEVVEPNIRVRTDAGLEELLACPPVTVEYPVTGHAFVPRGAHPAVISADVIPDGPVTIRLVLVPSGRAGEHVAVRAGDQALVVSEDVGGNILARLDGVVPGGAGAGRSVSLQTTTWGTGIPVEVRLVRSPTGVELFRDGLVVDAANGVSQPRLAGAGVDFKVMGVADAAYEFIAITPGQDVGPQQAIGEVADVLDELVVPGAVVCTGDALSPEDWFDVGDGVPCEAGNLRVADGELYVR